MTTNKVKLFFECLTILHLLQIGQNSTYQIIPSYPDALSDALLSLPSDCTHFAGHIFCSVFQIFSSSSQLNKYTFLIQMLIKNILFSRYTSSQSLPPISDISLSTCLHFFVNFFLSKNDI